MTDSNSAAITINFQGKIDDRLVKFFLIFLFILNLESLRPEKFQQIFQCSF